MRAIISLRSSNSTLQIVWVRSMLRNIINPATGRSRCGVQGMTVKSSVGFVVRRIKYLCKPRYRTALRLGALFLVAISGLLSACASHGPIGVDPDRNFSGVKDVIANLPDGGTLDVFLVHGMRADVPQTYADAIGAISRRLSLTDERTDPTVPLASAAPPVSLDGVSVFGPINWSTYQPRVTVERFRVRGTNKHINFYRFEYWRALAYIKCAFIIGPDTRVVGISSRSEYCNQKPYSVASGSRLSASSDLGNRWIKTEIMEWGLADAVIATSSYRVVLRQAIREMTAMALKEAIDQEGALSAGSRNPSATAELQRLAAIGMTRFVFITESLGSYVVHDALAQALSTTRRAVRQRELLEPNANARPLQAIAPVAVICGASQLDMFANQLALLRSSELSLGPSRTIERTSYFFRGCPQQSDGPKPLKGGVAVSARQVVAYHEPNDLLTYYTSDFPGDVGSSNRNTINVVVPFTSKWIWFLAADPIQAHTGQPEDRRIMDMIVCGRRPRHKIACYGR
jgi:hypothetical protein